MLLTILIVIKKENIIMTHDENVEQAHELFRSLVQAMLGRLSAMWADQGLSLPQIRLLFVLAHGGPATINQIAERLHSGQSATSLLVERLVQAHLAERSDDPADRRRAIVRLTEAGEAVMGHQRAGQRRLHVLLSEQDDAHLTAVIDILTAILDITNNDDSDTTSVNEQTFL
jgi:MarR family transcriptional regulator, organic hydroperoxide resistance regulator